MLRSICKVSLGAVVALAIVFPAAAETGFIPGQPPLNQRDYRMQSVNPVPYLLQDRNAARQNPGEAYVRVAPGQIVTKSVPGYPLLQKPVTGADRSQPAPTPVEPYMPPREDTDDGLRHTTGLDLGGQFGYYHYQEMHIQNIGPTDISIREDGLRYGATAAFTASLYGDWFGKVDARFAMGNVDYEGWLNGSPPTPTNIKDIPNYLGEVRAMFGHDWVFGNFAVAPMIGFGFRFLFDNAHDSSPNGYGRDSQYLYMPVAINPRVKLDNKDVLSLMVEYDYFIYGTQKSYLGDVLPPPGPGLAWDHLTNEQHGGYGVRAELNYEHKRWSFGPYVNYWNIDQSNIRPLGYEPHNQTLDMGIQFKYRLWQPGDHYWPGNLGR